jgi:fused signal recognition particle receptor
MSPTATFDDASTALPMVLIHDVRTKMRSLSFLSSVIIRQRYEKFVSLPDKNCDIMALFDIFKKKGAAGGTDPSASQSGEKSEGPEAQTPLDDKERGPQGGEAENASRKTLHSGLEKTREGLFSRIARTIAGRSTVDEEMLDSLEEVLITSDVGVDTTVNIIKRIEARVARDKYMNANELHTILREEIAALLEENDSGDFGTAPRRGEPCVLMVVGVNGVGKTTTIGKLAAQLTRAGKRVYIGAADTFRAAAIDQLQVWSDRAGATLVRQQMGSDPASVAYDTLCSAVAGAADVVLIDTAGRLHNKIGLMNELTKIRNVMAKVVPDAPHEVMLVLDGSTGQNAFEQATQFTAATKVNSLAITKLDGTAKGGVVIGISDRFRVPVRWIGVGEGIDDLQPFDRKTFVDALFA